MMFCPYHCPGEAAARVPEAASVFQSRTVAVSHPVRTTWAQRPLSELTDHIGEAFHESLRLELPRLSAQIAGLQRPCDEHCRVTAAIGQELRRFEAEVLARVTAEQDELFPVVVGRNLGSQGEHPLAQGVGRDQNVAKGGILRKLNRRRPAASGHRSRITTLLV